VSSEIDELEVRSQIGVGERPGELQCLDAGEGKGSRIED
jgi:hypothetical protein